jgi:hypothetical protein
MQHLLLHYIEHWIFIISAILWGNSIIANRECYICYLRVPKYLYRLVVYLLLALYITEETVKVGTKSASFT